MLATSLRLGELFVGVSGGPGIAALNDGAITPLFKRRRQRLFPAPLQSIGVVLIFIFCRDNSDADGKRQLAIIRKQLVSRYGVVQAIGDLVVFRKTNRRNYLGPQARDIYLSAHSKKYFYPVDKFRRVVDSRPDQQILLCTRRGKKYPVERMHPDLRRAS